MPRPFGPRNDIDLVSLAVACASPLSLRGDLPSIGRGDEATPQLIKSFSCVLTFKNMFCHFGEEAQQLCEVGYQNLLDFA
jgi:hypothetical protein